MTPEFCDPRSSRWAFKATVYKSPPAKALSVMATPTPPMFRSVVHGAEMRVAETRAVNRALRKAYGIGICSVEEIGSSKRRAESAPRIEETRPSLQTETVRRANRPRSSLPTHSPASARSPLWLSPTRLISAGVKSLRDATREQVENFVAHLADWAEKNRDASTLPAQ